MYIVTKFEAYEYETPVFIAKTQEEAENKAKELLSEEENQLVDGCGIYRASDDGETSRILAIGRHEV
jgi:hypothetical protein